MQRQSTITTRPLARGAAVLVVLLLAAACARTAKLRPEPAFAHQAGTDKVAIAAKQGVKLIVKADAWTGAQQVEEHVTPLWVRIENESDRPLRVRYSEFVLHGDRPRRALPLYAIEGAVDVPALAYRDAINTPGIVHSRFRVAPIYGPLYPGLPVYRGPFAHDRLYYQGYSYWTRVPLPTPDMRKLALPEGVLDPQGVVAGFLYFEKLDPKRARFRLAADLVSATTGEKLATIEIPFRNIRVAAPPAARAATARE